MTPDPAGLFFFHTPKAAGTAIATILAAQFPPETRCPLIENSQRDHEKRAGDYRSFRGYRYYGGHYGTDIFKQVASGHLLVSTFRDPVARLISLYTYFRTMVPVPEGEALRDDLYPVLFARQHDFRRFVTTDDPRIEVHTRNHQVRQFSGSAWDTESTGDLSQAINHLSRLSWFYICDHPERSQQWGRRVFGEGFGPIPRENVTRDCPRGGLDEHLCQIIRQKNGQDVLLYAEAERRLFSGPGLSRI